MNPPGGSDWDAVSLLAREAGDPQLALMVARCACVGGSLVGQ